MFLTVTSFIAELKEFSFIPISSLLSLKDVENFFPNKNIILSRCFLHLLQIKWMLLTEKYCKCSMYTLTFFT